MLLATNTLNPAASVRTACRRAMMSALVFPLPVTPLKRTSLWSSCRSAGSKRDCSRVGAPPRTSITRLLSTGQSPSASHTTPPSSLADGSALFSTSGMLVRLVVASFTRRSSHMTVLARSRAASRTVPSRSFSVIILLSMSPPASHSAGFASSTEPTESCSATEFLTPSPAYSLCCNELHTSSNNVIAPFPSRTHVSRCNVEPFGRGKSAKGARSVLLYSFSVNSFSSISTEGHSFC
uniref:Uncharacterized protein TCIL3000_4_2620 n=1 Tax=Trypanosoma congolense (strain IL3000) TaxID=1068625 RepID=G0ULB6_TRYCI|nr:unnamed protein product [Trypanosoma congolense IL3000]